MPIDQLIFVGLNGYVLALDRDSGLIVWSNNQLKGGYVTMILDGDRLIVSTNGYIYCLNPTDGAILWHNPLKGFGRGTPTSLLSVRGQVPHETLIQMVAEVEAQAQAAASASAGG